MRIYCMYDTIAEEAGPLFEARNDNIARRIINTMDVNSLPPGSKITDFKLMKLGYYDRGNEKQMPKITAYEKAMDITNAELMFGDEEYPEMTEGGLAG